MDILDARQNLVDWAVAKARSEGLEGLEVYRRAKWLVQEAVNLATSRIGGMEGQETRTRFFALTDAQKGGDQG